jgi:hypothetical protein
VAQAFPASNQLQLIHGKQVGEVAGYSGAQLNMLANVLHAQAID